MVEAHIFPAPGSQPAASSRRQPEIAELEERINLQYDTDASMAFYKFIMGGGGDDMHFGIFKTGHEDLMTASRNTVDFMVNLAQKVSALGTSTSETVSVLDVGAGKGGSARFLAKAFGCHVTCLNLGVNQNSYNLRRAKETGLQDLISIRQGSFNDSMPEEWSSAFDLVWIQESLCHAADKEFTLTEVHRVLKPGGALIFSDIMKGDVPCADLSSFTEHNVNKELASPSWYKQCLQKVGMTLANFNDLTSHLTNYFELMQKVVVDSKDELLAAGVELSRLEGYVESLGARFAKVKSREFAWGVFVSKKEEDFNSITAAVKALERRIQEQYDTDASMIFYKYIMGGGGDNMHYGIFKSGKEDLLTASHNTMEYMASLAAEHSALRTSSGGNMRVLDLGSGKGATARFLSKTFGCHVTCLNLGDNQNKYNLQKAQEEGISNRISVVKGSFNDFFPAEWTAQFDLVWSQEALCHAANRTMLCAEVDRVLKPGGSFVFSDIMRGETYQERLHGYSGGTFTAKLASPDEYSQAILGAGMTLSIYKDLTANLATYFSMTARSVREHRLAMLNAGVPGYRLEAYLQDLTARSDAVQERAFIWGAFVGKKPAMLKSPSASLLVENLSPSDNWCAVSSTMAEVEHKVHEDGTIEPGSLLNLARKVAQIDDAEDLNIGIKQEEGSVLEASRNMREFMINLASRISPLAAVKATGKAPQPINVLVLSAGRGSVARMLAQNYGCHVTCLEESGELNKINDNEAMAAGISTLIRTEVGSWTEKLSAAWTSRFDIVWMQEVMDNDSHLDIFAEVERVLKPGGSVILSNLMQVEYSVDLLASKPSVIQLRAAMDGSGLRVTKHWHLTPHLRSFLDLLASTLASSEHVSPGYLNHIQGMCVDAHQNRLDWGVLVGYKAHYNKCLLVGAGPLGSFAAWRLSACGICDITAKILPQTPPGVKDMLAVAGCRLITDWEDVEGAHFNTVMVATKTHWLARIAHEMSNYSLRWDHLALIYNGYVRIPEFFAGDSTASVVVPQSFSFLEDNIAAVWQALDALKSGVELTSVVNGNTGNPWTFPPRSSSKVIVAQLKQAGVNAAVSSTYEDDQFLKFCVNNSANLLAVLTGRNCRDLTGLPDSKTVMTSILQETFDVLQGDSKFAGLIPIEREEYIERVIQAVAAYQHHKPSSLQHFEQKRLADVAGLNGFITSMSRVTHVSSPVNDFIGRAADSACRAHRRGVTRATWSSVTELAAAMRLAEHMGLGNSVWSRATVRHPEVAENMMMPPFGNSFGEAYASSFQIVSTDVSKLESHEKQMFGQEALAMHATIYQHRPDVQCVLFTSSPYATTLASLAHEVAADAMQDDARFVGRVVVCPASNGDAEQLSDRLGKIASQPESLADVILLEKLGVAIIGPDVPTTFVRLCHLERWCKAKLLMRSAGASKSAPRINQSWPGVDGRSSPHAEWEDHKRKLMKLPGEFARPSYFE